MESDDDDQASSVKANLERKNKLAPRRRTEVKNAKRYESQPESLIQFDRKKVLYAIVGTSMPLVLSKLLAD